MASLSLERSRVACPYFLPEQELVQLGFTHPGRLPLGAPWRGSCNAPGHAGASPSEDELRNGCNLGYARGCSRLPGERTADSVRFAIVRERSGEIEVCYAYERNYLPKKHGSLQFKLNDGVWTTPESEAQLARMAQCFLQSFLRRREGRLKEDDDGRPGNP
jgi:hypothetical protein